MENKVALLISASFIAIVALHSYAWAQEATATPPDAPEAALAAQDGARGRWGISLGGGLEKVSVVSGTMFGLDGRLGVQMNNLLALYAQPHLSFGSLSGDAGGIGISGTTGTFAIAAIAEATLRDHFFAGAGVGYGVLNNPSGFMFQARLGGYPLMARAADGIRRRGLMVGVDIRTIFVEGVTGLLVLGSVGYEKF